MTKLPLLVEFLLLFVLLPLGVRLSPWRVTPFPLLWLATLYCYWMLRRDSSFPMARLWNFGAGVGQLFSVIGLFAVLAIVIGLGVRWFAPELFLGLVRSRPALWAVIMVAYPVLSVYPQSIIYRAFLMHRYAALFAYGRMDGGMQGVLLILLSAAAFGFMHIIFRNPLAVELTFAGGLLFAWRYQATGSLAISSLEHALYGCLMFTVGLGQYFYHGRVRLR